MSTSKPRQPDRPYSSYHHGNLRDALVAAGLELLESGQTAEVSLRELARQVGVSANATYRHFANKDALLAAMAAEGFRRLATVQAEAAMTRSQPAEMFLESGRAYVNFARRYPALFRLMFGRFTVMNRSEEINDAGQLALQGLRYGVAAALGREPDDAVVATSAIYAWSLVHGLSQLILDGHFDDQGDIEELVSAVLRQAADFGKKT